MEESRSVIEIFYHLRPQLLVPFCVAIFVTFLLVIIRLRAFFLKRAMNRDHDLIMLALIPVVMIMLGAFNIATHVYWQGLGADVAAAYASDEAAWMLYIGCILFILTALVALLPDRSKE